MPASVDPAVPPPPLGDSLIPRLARWCGCEDTPSRKAFIILTAARSALSSRFRSVEKRDHVSDGVTPTRLSIGRRAETYTTLDMLCTNVRTRSATSLRSSRNSFFDSFDVHLSFPLSPLLPYPSQLSLRIDSPRQLFGAKNSNFSKFFKFSRLVFESRLNDTQFEQ